VKVRLEKFLLLDDGAGWTIYWTEYKDDGVYPTPMARQKWRKLYGNNTVEEAIEDVLGYFGDLVKREDIKIGR
jgi:hypothetical protein